MASPPPHRRSAIPISALIHMAPSLPTVLQTPPPMRAGMHASPASSLLNLQSPLHPVVSRSHISPRDPTPIAPRSTPDSPVAVADVAHAYRTPSALSLRSNTGTTFLDHNDKSVRKVAESATCASSPRLAPLRIAPRCLKPLRRRPASRHHPEYTVKGRWKPEETALLVELVAKYGACKWSHIASHIPGRSDKQARERWKQHLDPALKKGGWTAAEDAVLRRTYAAVGNRWSLIARELPGRTDVDVRSRYKYCIRKGTWCSPQAGSFLERR